MSFSSQCFFEYNQRWPELRELIGELSDRDAVDLLLEALETRDRDLEDHLNNRPCGGVTMCSAADTVISDVGSDLNVFEEITLEQDATVKVDVTVTTSDLVSAVIFPYVDGANVVGPRMSQVAVADGTDFESANVALTWMETLSAGTHNIGFTLAAAVTGSSPEMQWAMTWIVGSDTGCSNVSYGGGA